MVPAMSPIRDFLGRLLPAGTPGAAPAAPVPADHAKELAAELGPVLSGLDEAEAERARILAEGERDARRIRDDARHRADDMVALARQGVPAARAAAATAVQAGAEADARAALRVAEQEAQAIRERAAERMPGLVSRAVRAVLALAGDEHIAGGEAAVGAAAGQTP